MAFFMANLEYSGEHMPGMDDDDDAAQGVRILPPARPGASGDGRAQERVEEGRKQQIR